MLLLWFGPAAGSEDALTLVREWLPLAIGDRWIYDQEIRGGNRQHPEVERWQYEETIVGSEEIPEGTLLRRKVSFLNHTAPPSWLHVSSESDILIRNGCLYYLDDSPARHRLSADFRNALDTGEALPDVCLPVHTGKTWGDPNKGRDLWTVAGRGPKNHDDPASVTPQSWRLEAHLASGDDNYIWFEKGIGITASRTFHNGTYNDQRVRLVRFEPAQR